MREPSSGVDLRALREALNALELDRSGTVDAVRVTDVAEESVRSFRQEAEPFRLEIESRSDDGRVTVRISRPQLSRENG